MNLLDAVFLVVFVLSIALGFKRGLSAEVISLLALILALILARALGPAMAGLLEDIFGVSSPWVTVVSFLLVFTIVLLLGRLATYLMRSFIRGLGLGNWERIGGVGFGLLRAFVLLMAFSLIIELTPFEDSDWYEDAQSIELAYDVNDALGLDWDVDDIIETVQEAGETIEENVSAKAVERLQREVGDSIEDFADVEASEAIDSLLDATDEIDADEAVEVIEKIGEAIND